MDLKDLSRGDFLLPMYFLQKLALEPNKKEEMVVKIAKFLEDFINNIKIDPSFSFVYSVMTSYQPLLKSNGIIVAAAHLDGLSALAWHAVKLDILTIEEAARLSVARVRLLQRTGFHSQASTGLSEVINRIGRQGSLSEDTQNNMDSQRVLLSIKDFSTNRSAKILDDSLDLELGESQRAQLLWRTGLAAARSADKEALKQVINDYQKYSLGENISRANVSLLNCLSELNGDPDRSICDARVYHEQLALAFDRPDTGADGTVHTLVASLYLLVVANRTKLGPKQYPLIAKLEQFRSNFKISNQSDGLREIQSSILFSGLIAANSFQLEPPSTLLSDELSQNKKENLHKIIAEIKAEVGS